jgi:4-amino-4-deoxy-L-arabinose transferase-like glycosyltransferase
VPLVVWCVTGLHIAVMAAYALLYLPYTNPDEAMHHDMVVAWLDGDGFARPGERELSEGVYDGFTVGFDAYVRPPFTDDTVLPRSERPTLEELGGDRPSTYPYPNQMTQHPPLYYGVLASLLAVVPGDTHWAWDQVVGVLRFANVLLLAPLPILAWATTRQLTSSSAAAMSAAFVPLLLPGLSRVGGSINNDNLLTLLAGILTLLLVRVCLGSTGRGTAIAVGAVTGLALLTKGFALVFIPIIALAYLVAWRRSRRAPWVPLLIAEGVAFVVGGWWWLRNLLVFGSVQPVGVGRQALEAIRGPEAATSLPRPILGFLEGFFDEFSRRIVAWLGLTEPPNFPFWVAATVMVLLVAGVVLALALGRRAAVTAGTVAVCVLPTVLILAMVVYGSYTNWRTYLQFSGVQGRYLYPGIVGVAAITAIGWSTVLARGRRFLPLATLALAGFAQFMAAKLIVATFWLPPWAGSTRVGDADVAWETIARWSPWPGAVTLVVFLALVAFAAATLAATLRSTVRGEVTDQPDRGVPEPALAAGQAVGPGGPPPPVPLARDTLTERRGAPA